jgi:hypothetical protein
MVFSQKSQAQNLYDFVKRSPGFETIFFNVGPLRLAQSYD